jgi:hypothetical protein
MEAQCRGDASAATSKKYMEKGRAREGKDIDRSLPLRQL